MLDDRTYMRRSYSAGPRMSATGLLLVATVVVFILQWLFETDLARLPVGERLHAWENDFFYKYLYLSPEGIKHGFIWQLITFQFLHGDFWHILFNGLVIFFFGRAMEEVLGPRQFLWLYFSGGVIGGIAQMLFAFSWPALFGGPVVGASAGASALIAAFAMRFPFRQLTLLVFFIIPITMRARTLLYLLGGMGVIGLIMGLFGMGGNIAHAGHLGGMVAGMAYLHYLDRGSLGATEWWTPPKPRRRRSPVRVVHTYSRQEDPWPETPPPLEELPSADFISREIDPILDKISAHGLHSLTEEERRILQRARDRMSGG